MNQPIVTKIAVMSLAHLHAVSYIRALTALPGVEVRVSDPDHSARPTGEIGGVELARTLGVPYVDSYAELLAWQPDGVIVCSENGRHRELVEQAAAAGAQVLCEKPLATNPADARAMIEACQAAGVFLMVAYPVRFSPAFAALRNAYDEGRLGEVVAVTGTNNGQIPIGNRAWFVDPELAGGGSLMDHTVHLADLLDLLWGGVPVTSVYATTNRILHAQRVAVETGGLVSLRYANGVIATIDCSWSKPDSYPTWGGLTLQLVGTGGIADLDAFASRVGGHSETAGNAVWLPYGTDSDARLIEEFVDAIVTGRVPQPDGEVGYRTLLVAAAGYASVQSGQPVDVRTIEV
ncbi:MAG: Gfo/Idh/MocA family oxidoreductase [Propionibacteriaceae bacterium]